MGVIYVARRLKYVGVDAVTP